MKQRGIRQNEPSNTFQLELFSAMAGLRGLLMKLGFTLLLGFPFVVVRMPQAVKVSGILMLLLFTSFFGAAVAVVRRRGDGRLLKLRLLPIPRWIQAVDLVLASAAVDLVQMGVVLVVYLLFNATGPGVGLLIRIAALFVAGDLLLNMLGLGLGVALKSNAEVHLSAALSVGVLALLSGVVPVPRALQGVVETVSRVNPLALLARSLTAVSDPGVLESGLPWVGLVLILAVSLFLWRGVDWSGRGRNRQIP